MFGQNLTLAPFSLENITSIHIISQRLNVVLGTLTGKKKYHSACKLWPAFWSECPNLPLLLLLSDRMQLAVPCAEPGGGLGPVHSLPGAASGLLMAFFGLFVPKHHLCTAFSLPVLFEEKLSQMFCCASAEDAWPEEMLYCSSWMPLILQYSLGNMAFSCHWYFNYSHLPCLEES